MKIIYKFIVKEMNYDLHLCLHKTNCNRQKHMCVNLQVIPIISFTIQRHVQNFTNTLMVSYLPQRNRQSFHRKKNLL